MTRDEATFLVRERMADYWPQLGTEEFPQERIRLLIEEVLTFDFEDGEAAIQTLARADKWVPTAEKVGATCKQARWRRLQAAKQHRSHQPPATVGTPGKCIVCGTKAGQPTAWTHDVTVCLCRECWDRQKTPDIIDAIDKAIADVSGSLPTQAGARLPISLAVKTMWGTSRERWLASLELLTLVLKAGWAPEPFLNRVVQCGKLPGAGPKGTDLTPEQITAGTKAAYEKAGIVTDDVDAFKVTD